MNNNQHFDEHIQEQFKDYSPDVPAHIWEKIVAGKDQKKPVGFWVSMFNNRSKLLLIGLIIALSSGGAWYYIHQNYFNNNTVAVTDNNSSAKNNRTATPGSNTTQEAELVTTEQSPVEQPAATNNEDKESSGTKFRSALSSSTGFTASISPASAETVDNNDVEDNNSTTTIKAKNKKRFAGLGNVLIKTTSPEAEEDAFEGQGTLLGRLSFAGEKYAAKRKSGKPEKLSFKPVVFLPDCPSLEKDAAGNKKYFEFYAGPDYAFRSLADTGNSAYLQQRKESTKFRSAFSAGVRYTRVFSNSMSVRGGINYSQINEKFTFNQGNVIQITYITNSNGDTIGSYSTTGSRYKTTINRYRSVDIPLVVGYEVGNGKLHANINAGAMINIYSWQKGDVLDMLGNPVSITTGKSASPYQFKTNAGIGFIGAVSIYYKLNDRLHLMAEPYFRYNFSQMNKESITLKQKYQTAGLRLGIRLDLK